MSLLLHLGKDIKSLPQKSETKHSRVADIVIISD